MLKSLERKETAGGANHGAKTRWYVDLPRRRGPRLLRALRGLFRNQSLIDWIAARGPQVETLTSVCTGAMLLGRAGLLDGRRATTHWRSLDWMRDSFPTVTVEDQLHVVEDGHVLTSAGISAGIDLALRVVARYHGEAVASATARHMEYPYPEDNARRV
jgi:transcriptional regulator GlxA family with amidase domain